MVWTIKEGLSDRTGDLLLRTSGTPVGGPALHPAGHVPVPKALQDAGPRAVAGESGGRGSCPAPAGGHCRPQSRTVLAWQNMVALPVISGLVEQGWVLRGCLDFTRRSLKNHKPNTEEAL